MFGVDPAKTLSTRHLAEDYQAGDERLRVMRHEVDFPEGAKGDEMRVREAFEWNIALDPQGSFVVMPEARYDRNIEGEMGALQTWLTAPPAAVARPNLTRVLET